MSSITHPTLPKFITKAVKASKTPFKPKKPGKPRQPGDLGARASLGDEHRCKVLQARVEAAVAGKRHPDVIKALREEEALARARIAHMKGSIAIEVRERTANGQPREYGARVKDQLPIDRYYDRHELYPRPDSIMNAALYRAAMKMREDFYSSRLMESGSTSFVHMPGSKGAPDKAMTLHIASLVAYNKAVLAMSASLRPLLIHVVCYDGTARDWALKNRDNPNAGLALLRCALMDLAGYYGFLDQKHRR